MTTRYQKTEAGRQAIRERSLALSRPARNLLLILDASRSGADWVALVAGSAPADLAQLAELGLVEPVGLVPPAPAPLPEPLPEPLQVAAEQEVSPPAAVVLDTLPAPLAQALPPVVPPDAPLSVRLEAMGRSVLYERLTALARPTLGLIQGYRMILDIEKCGGVDELRSLATRFVDQVRSSKGDHAAVRLSESICAGLS